MDNAKHRYWTVSNGYTFSTDAALSQLDTALTEEMKTRVRGAVKVGVHRDSGVVFSKRGDEHGAGGRVTQVYGSAISCSYSGVRTHLWEHFARLVLEANYEATLWAAVTSSLSGTEVGTAPDYRGHVFLTFLGGGVFGNDMAWIVDAINWAVAEVRRSGAGLHVHVCHYAKINEQVAAHVK
jgi:hypothetical protein